MKRNVKGVKRDSVWSEVLLSAGVEGLLQRAVEVDHLFYQAREEEFMWQGTGKSFVDSAGWSWLLYY
ncbi:hypothetical protein ATW55_02415 [Ferroacidibacillus organovorans]|uniref:Uncharacterized protein n=1 Tax=Ferroacidibacillus organovorans TaxID=1765683 RepID=A0A101XR11_9BACL|nr:hypothetical protein ATW55_02415 [Ferroacidibacillus organovorans]